jgi:hypothetical protein
VQLTQPAAGSALLRSGLVGEADKATAVAAGGIRAVAVLDARLPAASLAAGAAGSAWERYDALFAEVLAENGGVVATCQVSVPPPGRATRCSSVSSFSGNPA